MRVRVSAITFALALVAQPVVLDRIAIVVNSSIIKDSDIARDIRLTDFLNGDPLAFSPEARKKAAGRLIDQVFMRREIRLGDYPTPTVEEAQKDVQSIEHDRFKSQAAMDAALERYGLTEADLQMYLQWQLTVLNFIDARFKPAAYIAPEQVDTYVKAHQAELQKQYPNATPAELNTDVQNTLSEQKVNQIFFNWLDTQRKEAKIRYPEDSLQ